MKEIEQYEKQQLKDSSTRANANMDFLAQDDLHCLKPDKFQMVMDLSDEDLKNLEDTIKSKEDSTIKELGDAQVSNIEGRGTETTIKTEENAKKTIGTIDTIRDDIRRGKTLKSHITNLNNCSETKPPINPQTYLDNMPASDLKDLKLYVAPQSRPVIYDHLERKTKLSDDVKKVVTGKTDQPKKEEAVSSEIASPTLKSSSIKAKENKGIPVLAGKEVLRNKIGELKLENPQREGELHQNVMTAYRAIKKNTNFEDKDYKESIKKQLQKLDSQEFSLLASLVNDRRNAGTLVEGDPIKNEDHYQKIFEAIYEEMAGRKAQKK
jgi:hypothetical protein